MMASVAVQTVVPFVVTVIRPFVAFSVLAPMWSLGLAGLWGARHGTFPPKVEPEDDPGAVRSVGEALTDPQTLARHMVEHVEHPSIGLLPVLGVPVKLSTTPGSVRSAPPRLGEHTRQVLHQDLGYDDARINAIAKTGAIRLLEP